MVTPLSTGDLRERVTVQSVTESADTQGGRSRSTSTLATVWARVTVAAPGTESQAGGQVVGSTTYVVTIRYSSTVSAVTTKHQVTWRGKTLNVSAVVPWPSREAIDLYCAEVAA